MYALAITIDHCYWKHDCKRHYTRQVEKEALESHSQKQGKASTSGPAIASQNKVNLSLVAPSTKNFSFKSPTSKKQSDSLQVDLSSKLDSNGKLTSNKCKKYLENNLCLYCRARDYKLDFCSKKQTMVTPKDCGASATADPWAAVSKKLSEK